VNLFCVHDCILSCSQADPINASLYKYRIGQHKAFTNRVFLHRFFRRHSYDSTIDEVLIKQGGLGRIMFEWVMDGIKDLKASNCPIHPYSFARVAECGVDALKQTEDIEKQPLLDIIISCSGSIS
jgi:hypothetical protein